MTDKLKTKESILFSQRQGLSPMPLFQKDSMNDDLRNSLWNNCLYPLYNMHQTRNESGILVELFERYWKDFFKMSLSKKPGYMYPEIIEDFILKKPWYRVYDLCEFTLKQDDILGQKTCNELRKDFNIISKRENSAYRVIGNIITEITNDIEIQSIEQTLALNSPYQGVSKHTEKALRYLSDREKPDYANSIKESISAVECAAKIITGEKKDFKRAISKLKLPESLDTALDKLWGYASGEQGIRHSLISGNKANVSDHEAKLMLVICSAIANFLIAKYPTEKQV